MGTIQLHDRTRLPTSQVAAVRPRELPAEEGEPTLEFAAELAGDIFDKAMISRAGNEESEFRGSVDTAIQDYETALAENPGMTEEELDKLETATISEIDGFNKLATLPQSKQYIKDYNLKNRELLIAKLKTIKGKIVTAQETDRFSANRERLIRELDDVGLGKLYDDEAGNLFDPDTAQVNFLNDLSRIDATQSRIDAAVATKLLAAQKAAKIEAKKAEKEAEEAGIEDAMFDAFNAWVVTVTDEKPDGDLNVVFNMIAKDPRVPVQEKQETESEVKTMIDNRRAEWKLDAEARDEAEKQAEQKATDEIIKVIDEMFIKPQDEFVASAPEALRIINESDLPVRGKNGIDKEGQRKKIKARFDAIKAGDIDPIDEFDPTVYNQMSTAISRSPNAYSFTDISGRIGIDISQGQGKTLTALKKFYEGADVIGKALHQNYAGAITGLRVAKVFNRDKVKNVALAASARSALDAWAIQETRTAADYETFFSGLIDSTELSGWYKFFHSAGFEKAAQERQIKEYLDIQAGEERGVLVENPDGVRGYVPTNELKQALKEGYKRIE